MKKFLFFIAVIVLLAGCSSQDKQDEDVANDSKSTKEQAASVDKETASLNLTELDIQTPDGKIKVKGKASTTNDEFFYVLKYGDDVIINETKVTLDPDDTGWGAFDLDLDQPENEVSSDEVPIFTFYVKDKAGKRINPNYVPVDINE
ncbi:hypothetical protein WMZ97_20030 [Lentibacillus sp. N15]|uniref:hypothetical protein n=1 Tax=Lentibacillus songyuanensis TaxID=3136161 RepID=UPI0031BA9D96